MDSIESHINDISCWMSANMLQLNTNKMEAIIFQPKSLLVDLDCVHLSNAAAGSAITPFETMWNLAVMWDSHLNMDKHISSFHISRIARNAA